MSFPIFLKNKKVYEIFKEIQRAVPKKSKFFLVGGALRNSVYYHYHKKKLKQRDYDFEFYGNKKEFIKNIRKIGFIYGKIRRKHQTTFRKKINKNPEKLEDFIILDIIFSKEEDIYKRLKNKINFTINGFAIEINDIFNKNWINNLIKLPYSIIDLKSKQLRLNTEKTDFFATNLYDCIRLISLGFKKPSKEEISVLLKYLKKIPKYKFERNKPKVYNYVGGEQKTKKIVKSLGIKENIFNYKTIKKPKT